MRVDLLKVSTALIRLRYVATPKGGLCSAPNDNPAPLVLRVPVGRRIQGQRIGGTQRLTSAINRLAWDQIFGSSGASGFPAPSLVGLRIRDAWRLLEPLGLARSSFQISGPNPGWITSQTPAPGQPVDPQTMTVAVQTAAP